MANPDINYKEERESDLNKILESKHGKKVVVAGPGTGKSYLFEQEIKSKLKQGKNDFVAITFIGKLGDALADDLAGLAKTMTLHGYARKFVLDNLNKDWEYYPFIGAIIKEDFGLKGIKEFEIGDENYRERTEYYKAVGDIDVVHYAAQICKKHPDKIPIHDLILIDEFQDFNETEAEFVDLLATKNEVLIVGDDDQALYEFKGSSPKFIREKYNEDENGYQKHSLRFCSRCPEVIIRSFHGVLKHFGFNNPESGRIQKEYTCYIPDKQKDSDANPKIIVHQSTPLGMIPGIIKNELRELLESQKIKSVLVIGEGRSCGKTLTKIASGLSENGFKYVDSGFDRSKAYAFKSHVVDGYKILSKNKNKLLAWRLLIKEYPDADAGLKLVKENINNSEAFINSISKDFRKSHEKNAKTFSKLINDTPSKRKLINDASVEMLQAAIIKNEKTKREMFTDQLVKENKFLSRPLGSLDITVCNILGSKGLGADIVFLVGFDNGKFPVKAEVHESEIYQFLVALTRTKKRIYLINSIGSDISNFIHCFNAEDCDITVHKVGK